MQFKYSYLSNNKNIPWNLGFIGMLVLFSVLFPLLQSIVYAEELSARQHYDKAVGAYNKSDLKTAAAEFNKTLELDPKNKRAAYYLGMVYWVGGNRKGAVEVFETAVALFPNFYRVYVNLGKLRESFGDFSGAIDAYRLTIKHGEGTNEAKEAERRWKQLGKTGEDAIKVKNAIVQGSDLLSKGKLDEAIFVLTPAVQIVPDHIRANFLLGIIYGQKQAEDKALKYFEKVVEIDPKHYVSHYNAGVILEKKSNNNAAVRHYLVVDKLGKGSPEGKDVIGRLIQLGRDPEKANDLIQYYKEGIRLVGEDKADDAMKLFNKMLDIAPGNVSAHFYVGLVYGRKGMADEAYEEFMKVKAIEPNHFPSRFSLAVVYEGRGEFEKALEEYQAVIKLGGRSREARDSRKRIPLIKAKLVSDVTGVKKAKVHFKRALALFKDKKTDEAIEEFKTSIEIDPNNSYAYFNLAVIYGDTGEFEKSFVQLKKAVAIKEDHIPSHFRLGLYYMAAGLMQNAIKSYNKVIELAVAAGKEEQWEYKEAKLRLKDIGGKLGVAKEGIGYFIVAETLAVRTDDISEEREILYKEALKRSPGKVLFHMSYGAFLEKEEREEDAVIQYLEVLKNNQKKIAAMLRLAILYEKLGEYDKVAEFYDKGFKLDEKSPEVHYYYAGYLMREEKLEEAKKYYKNTIEFGNKSDDPKIKQYVDLSRKKVSYVNQRLKVLYLNFRHEFFSYDSNINKSDVREQADVSQSITADFTWLLLKKDKLVMPVSIKTSDVMFVKRQSVYSNSSLQGKLTYRWIPEGSIDLGVMLIRSYSNLGPTNNTNMFNAEVSIANRLPVDIKLVWSKEHIKNIANRLLDENVFKLNSTLGYRLRGVGKTTVNGGYVRRVNRRRTASGKKIPPNYDFSSSQGINLTKSNLGYTYSFRGDIGPTYGFRYSQVLEEAGSVNMSYRYNRDIPQSYTVSLTPKLGEIAKVSLGSVTIGFTSTRKESPLRDQSFNSTVNSLSYKRSFLKEALKMSAKYSITKRAFTNPDSIAFRDFGIEVFRKNKLLNSRINLIYVLDNGASVEMALENINNISSLRGQIVNLDELITQDKISLGNYLQNKVKLTYSGSF